jgi:hypothetical protein
MLAVVDAFEPLPSTGSKVRLTAIFAGETEKWVVRTVAPMGCGLSVRFGADVANKQLGDASWGDTLRTALAHARALENELTRKLTVERAACRRSKWNRRSRIKS